MDVVEILVNIIMSLVTGVISGIIVNYGFETRAKKKQHIDDLEKEIFRIQERIPECYTKILDLIYSNNMLFAIKIEFLKNFLTIYAVYPETEKTYPDLYKKIIAFYNMLYKAVKEICDKTNNEKENNLKELITREIFLNEYYEPLRKEVGEILVLSSRKYEVLCKDKYKRKSK